ncbi:hypothetical protein [Candidatus Nanohalobium constans]|nr:hypothetical protein [Candidatus Nanohalobium constans]
MASAQNSSEYVELIAGLHDGSEVVAVEERFPGIFKEYNGNYDGEVDLLVSEGGIPEKLRAYEVKDVESLNQHTIVSHAARAREQCENIEEHFESLGYEVEAECLINPQGHLAAVKEMYDSFERDLFDLDDAKDIISEPGRMPHLKEEALEENEEGLYKINNELAAVLESGLIQP